MTIYLKERAVVGWKAKENKRYGDCIVIKMCEEKTHKELFELAIYLHDIPFLEQVIKDVKLLDELHKATLNHIEMVNTRQTTLELNKQNACKVVKNE